MLQLYLYVDVMVCVCQT